MCFPPNLSGNTKPYNRITVELKLCNVKGRQTRRRPYNRITVELKSVSALMASYKAFL